MANNMDDAVQGSPEGYKGMYGSLKFPPKKHQEYPKLLYRPDGKLLGTAANAMEEKELYASIGVDKADIDPLASAQDELAVLRAKLAQYEGPSAGAIAPTKIAGVKTSSVEMLPKEQEKNPTASVVPEHKEISPEGANPTYNPPPGGDPAQVQHPVPKAGQTPAPGNKQANPLLAGKPQPQGTAPAVTKQIDPGV